MTFARLLATWLTAMAPVLTGCSMPQAALDCTQAADTLPCREAPMRARFGVPPIQDLASSGRTVRRAFSISPFDHLYPVVTFERDEAGVSQVSVRVLLPAIFPVRGDDPPVRVVSLNAQISADVFEEVASHTPDLSTYPPLPKRKPLALTPPVTSPPGSPGPAPEQVCLDGETFVIEAADEKQSQSKTQSGCFAQEYEAYAQLLYSKAATLIPQCAPLYELRSLDSSEKLEVCALLHGNPRIAADAFKAFYNTDPPWAADGVLSWSGYGQWSGSQVSEAWSRLRSEHSEMVAFPLRIDGHDRGFADITGVVRRSVGACGDGDEFARFGASVRITAGKAEVTEMTVEGFSIGPVTPVY